MDIKQKYREETNLDVYPKGILGVGASFSNEYVKWLEEQLRIANVVKSLPNKEEILFEPISNALYATNRFTTDQCTNLTNGIIQYIDDYKIDVIKK